jgi:hypothetical protein
VVAWVPRFPKSRKIKARRAAAEHRYSHGDFLISNFYV